MSTEKQLMEIFNVVIDEIKNNKEFAKKIDDILGNKVVETKVKKRGRQPAKFNPNIEALKGEGVLKDKLEKLEVSQLKDIISEYAMDMAKLTSRWKSKDKLIKYIIEVASSRLAKGDVFRE